MLKKKKANSKMKNNINVFSKTVKKNILHKYHLIIIKKLNITL
jgi:hypothetical protein